MEMRPIGQIKVTKGDLGSAGPDGAESSQGSGQRFPSLPLVPREPPSQVSRLRSSSKGEGPAYHITERYFPRRPKVAPKEEPLEWCPAFSWDSLPHPPLSEDREREDREGEDREWEDREQEDREREDREQEGPWLGIQSRERLKCDCGLSGLCPQGKLQRAFCSRGERT